MEASTGNLRKLEVDRARAAIWRSAVRGRAGATYHRVVIYRLSGRVTGSVITMPESARRRLRLDVDLLDLENPFEIDEGNRPHLFKHLPNDDDGRPVSVGPEDLLDLYAYGDPDYYEASEGGEADWLMIGMVPGLIICVPIASPRSGDARFCRPIGIYKPSVADRNRYLRGQDDE